MILTGAVDQGTSSSRFIIFNSDNGAIIAMHQVEVKQIFPKAGWVEMDAKEIYTSVIHCIEKACEKLITKGYKAQDVKAIGIANQRETTILWSKSTGEPLCNAIVWLDGRTSTLAEEYTNKTPNKSKDYFKTKTGLPIHPYFSALKIRWMIDNDDSVKNALKKGDLLFGNVDSWLIWKMTGKHITDVTNASRTLFLDLHKMKWSSQLCNFFNIPQDILPEIRSSAEIYGEIRMGVLKGTKVSGCLGDQQAALIGHNCMRFGETKVTYGTGTFMLCNIGENRIISKNGLLTTVAFQLGNRANVCYALEGAGSIGGNAVKFIRDNFGFIKKASEIEELAASVNNVDNIIFVPCFTGLFTPYWDPCARGTICGLSQFTTKAHIARAALEATCFQTAEIIEAIEEDMSKIHKISSIKVDGGMTVNELFNQMQSDLLGKAISCTRSAELTSWGAAVAAAIGAKILSFEEFNERKMESTKIYLPRIDPETRNERLRKWKKAVKNSLNWVDSESEGNSNSK